MGTIVDDKQVIDKLIKQSKAARKNFEQKAGIERQIYEKATKQQKPIIEAVQAAAQQTAVKAQRSVDTLDRLYTPSQINRWAKKEEGDYDNRSDFGFSAEPPSTTSNIEGDDINISDLDPTKEDFNFDFIYVSINKVYNDYNDYDLQKLQKHFKQEAMSNIDWCTLIMLAKHKYILFDHIRAYNHYGIDLFIYWATNNVAGVGN